MHWFFEYMQLLCLCMLHGHLWSRIGLIVYDYEIRYSTDLELCITIIFTQALSVKDFSLYNV